MFLPLFWLLLTTLKEESEIYRLPLRWFPDNIFNLKNYFEVFRQAPFGRYLLNSAIVSVISIISSILFSSLAGFGFAKYKFPGRNIIFIAVIGLLMIPFEIAIVPLYLLFKFFGLLNSYIGVCGPNLISPFGVFLMRQFIYGIPNDYIDAARINGLSDFQIYFRIILPLIKPAIAALGVIKFLWTWNAFLWPLIIVNSQEMFIATVGLANFTNQYYIKYHLATSATLISIIPVIIVFIILQKLFIKSMVMFGIKG